MIYVTGLVHGMLVLNVAYISTIECLDDASWLQLHVYWISMVLATAYSWIMMFYVMIPTSIYFLGLVLLGINGLHMIRLSLFYKPKSPLKEPLLNGEYPC